MHSFAYVLLCLCPLYTWVTPRTHPPILGLEKRIRDLLIGYRELNDLAEQAPLHVASAASDYAQSLGGHPHRASPSPGASGGQQHEQARTNVFGFWLLRCCTSADRNILEFSHGVWQYRGNDLIGRVSCAAAVG